VKDSSGDPKNLGAYRDAVPRWSVLVGSGSLLYAALELGCDGGVLAVACFAARVCAGILTAFRAGDRARAGSLQERLVPLDKEIVAKLGPAGVKAAMDLGEPGCTAGRCARRSRPSRQRTGSAWPSSSPRDRLPGLAGGAGRPQARRHAPRRAGARSPEARARGPRVRGHGAALHRALGAAPARPRPAL